MVIQPSDFNNTNVYEAPPNVTNGALKLTNNVLEWDSAYLSHQAELDQITNDLNASIAKIVALENSSVKTAVQVTEYLTGLTEDPSVGVWGTWVPTAGDVSQYINGIPQLGIVADFASWTPIQQGLATLNIIEDQPGETAYSFFRVLKDGQEIAAAMNTGANVQSSAVLNFPVEVGSVYTFERKKQSAGSGNIRFNVISVTFLGLL